MEVLTFFVMIIGLILNPSPNIIYIGGIVILGLMTIQFVMLEIINVIFSYVGHNRILITKNKIEVKPNIINVDETVRLVYSRISLDSFVTGQAGELILINNHKRVFLGCYFINEINNMKSLISNIEFELTKINK